jgi:hypothetical protein
MTDDWRCEQVGVGVSRCPFDYDNHLAQREVRVLDHVRDACFRYDPDFAASFHVPFHQAD